MFGNIQDSFNGMFGKIAPGMCRLTMNGNIAVKCANGYKAYNVEKETLTNVTNFCFNVGDEMDRVKEFEGRFLEVNTYDSALIK